MRFLVIGGGSIGQRHAKNLREMGHEVAIWDIDCHRAAAACADIDGSQLGSKPAEKLTEEMDAVLVCTPPVSHVLYALKALQEDKPVFIEKPVADSLKEVYFLPNNPSPALVMPATNYRWHPGIQRLKAAIDGGELGEIIHVRAEYGQALEQWKGAYERDPWLEAGIHLVDYCWWLLGIGDFYEPAYAFISSDGNHNQRCIQFQCKPTARGQPTVSIYVDWVQPERHHWVTVFGTKGWASEYLFPNNQMYVDQMKHFIACIEGREQPICPIGEAVKILEVTLAARGQ